MKTLPTALLPLFLLLSSLLTTANAADKVDFDSQVKPIFNKYCLECHGEDNEEAFRIDINDDMMLYVNEGSPETSDLYTYMTLDEDDDNLMPPVDHEPRPAASEIQLVKTWVAQGASLDAADDADDADDESEAGVADADTEKAKDAKDKAAAAPIDPQTQRIYNALGSLHTAAVHLPVGLLLAAGLFALFSLGGSFVMSDCAYYCLWLGTLGAIFANVSGWYYSPMEHRGTVNDLADLFDQSQPVFWHRAGGIISTIVALLLCLFAKGARGRNPDDGMMWKFGAILLAGAIGWVGYTGGKLTYGDDHYKDLNALVESVINSATADDADEADEAGSDEADAEGDDQDETDEADESEEPASDDDSGTDSQPDDAAQQGILEGNLDV